MSNTINYVAPVPTKYFQEHIIWGYRFWNKGKVIFQVSTGSGKKARQIAIDEAKQICGISNDTRGEVFYYHQNQQFPIIDLRNISD